MPGFISPSGSSAVVGACYALNLSVVPVSYAAFREYQFEIRNKVAAFLLQEGVFTPISDDLTVYVRSRDQDGALRGILVEDARQRNSRATILAERGRLVNGANGPRVLLQNGSRQEIDRVSGRLNILTFAENAVDLATNSKAGEQRYRDASEMTLQELLHPDASVPARDVGKLQVEGHRRLSSPLTAASFALVALVSVLTGGFRRHGGIVRPVAAVLVVVALLALGLTVANLAARQPLLLPLIWVQAVMPGLICLGVLFGPWHGLEVRRSVAAGV